MIQWRQHAKTAKSPPNRHAENARKHATLLYQRLTAQTLQRITTPQITQQAHCNKAHNNTLRTKAALYWLQPAPQGKSKESMHVRHSFAALLPYRSAFSLYSLLGYHNIVHHHLCLSILVLISL